MCDLTGLTDLVLYSNRISDISALSSLANVHHRNLNNNIVSDISVLANLTNLRYLGLAINGISDISALANLSGLIQLNLYDNILSDISVLADLTNLTELELNHNTISNLSALSRLTHLKELNFNGNCISEISALSELSNLVRLDLANNRIVDISPLVTNAGLGDGHVDIFYAPSEGWRLEPTIPAELYLNDGRGCFTLDTSFLGGNPPGRLAPRKALPGDFNGDGRMDVFVLDHGYDKPPFPGAAPYVILSTENGSVLGSGLETLVGFQHGGASADVDADGDIDVFVTHLNAIHGPFFLINDGAGSFALDADRVEGLAHKALFTAELVDVDGDGYLDLLAAGHEFDPYGDNFATRILWGDSTRVYSTGRATVLPAVFGQGVVVDIDASDTNGDGDKDIVINRTGDERTASYRGYYVQLVEQVGKRRFEDRTAQLLHRNEDAGADWIVWIRMCDRDADGDVDIVVDDAARDLIWKNDGTGEFHPR